MVSNISPKVNLIYAELPERHDYFINHLYLLKRYKSNLSMVGTLPAKTRKAVIFHL